MITLLNKAIGWEKGSVKLCVLCVSVLKIFSTEAQKHRDYFLIVEPRRARRSQSLNF